MAWCLEEYVVFGEFLWELDCGWRLSRQRAGVLVVLSLRPRQGMTVPCMVGWVVDRSVCWLVDCMSVVFLVGPLFFFRGEIGIGFAHRSSYSSEQLEYQQQAVTAVVACCVHGTVATRGGRRYDGATEGARCRQRAARALVHVSPKDGVFFFPKTNDFFLFFSPNDLLCFIRPTFV